MRRREFVTVAGSVPFWSVSAVARDKALAVVGVLVTGTPNPAFALREFRRGLRALDYDEGQTLRLIVLSAEGRPERLPFLASELIRQGVDVIAAWLTQPVLAAKQATAEIPIVMIGAADPVGMGIVSNLARPGANITGIAGLVAGLTAKNVELLKEALPKLDRIAALCNAPDPFAKRFLEQVRLCSAAQSVKIVPVEIAVASDLTAAFARMAGDGLAAAIVQPGLPLRHVAELAVEHRIAVVSPRAQFPGEGGLFAYAADDQANYVRAASFVDKILRGAKAGDLPVEQPTKFKLIINVKTAGEIGVTMPRALLERADETIE
jgi:putative ABC transport system substrate-binding protein